jgi:DNA-binding transcriptional regulator YhcF (GntR family)
LHVDGDGRTPKYAQIVACVTDGIRGGALSRGDALPSVSAVCREFSLARETVVKAYGVLKRLGIVEALPRKGYYVRTEALDHTVRVLLLFDEFSPYKHTLYDAFMAELGPQGTFDIFFHHYDVRMYESIVRDNAGSYDMYVLMPYAEPKLPQIVESLEAERVLMLDRCEEVSDRYPRITQHIKGAIYDGLKTGEEALRAYDEVVLVFPEPSNHPRVIIHDFNAFCRDAGIRGRVAHAIGDVALTRGKAYIVLDDGDLVQVVERCERKGYELGADVGVVSYNDTEMKRVVAGGISVITTDFAELGRRAARYVLCPDQRREVVPTRIIRRKSL